MCLVIESKKIEIQFRLSVFVDVFPLCLHYWPIFRVNGLKINCNLENYCSFIFGSQKNEAMN